MQVLTIRYYQLKRNLGMLLPALLMGCSAVSYFFFNNYQQLGYYTAGLIVYLFYSFHTNRTDKAFAERYFVHARWQMALEYQLFLLPVSLPSLFTAYALCFPLMHIAVLAIPFMRIRSDIRPRLLFLSRLFGTDYVFISGLRRQVWSLSVFGTLALLLSPVKLFPLVALFVVNLILFGFQEHPDSLQMLQASGDTPKHFLFRQSVSALTKLALINIPVLVVNILFNTDMLLFDLYFLAYNLLTMAAAVSMKYAAYAYPVTKTNQQMKLAVMLFGLMNPYMSLISLVFYFVSRKNAIHNLSAYLDDRDEGSGICLR